jgi:tetratricopeptide (TPR) repeat protein
MLLNAQMEKGRRTIVLVAAGLFSVVQVGMAYRQAGYWKNSETLWTRVIELYPYEYTQSGNAITVTKVGAQVAYGSRAFYWAEKGRNDEAYRDLSMLANLKVQDPRIYDRLGVLCGQRGELQKSLEYLNMVIAMGKNSASTFYNRGITYANMKRSEEAVADFSKAVSMGLPPDDELAARRGLMMESLAINKLNDAFSFATDFMQRYPASPDGYFYGGTALVNLGRNAEAVQALSKAVQLLPTMANAWFNLSIAHLRTGNKKDARIAALEAKKLGFAVSDVYLGKLQ